MTNLTRRVSKLSCPNTSHEGIAGPLGRKSGGGSPAEFDGYAAAYYDRHKANVAASGELPEYFSEYKISDLRRMASEASLSASAIFDFGCGIGNSIPFFRRYFDTAQITSGDVSLEILEIASKRFPSMSRLIHIEEQIPLETESQDIVFAACVFHHIDEAKQDFWVRELLRVARPGGLLFIYEHNPFNPLTVHAVNTCPFDANAKLLRPSQLMNLARRAGWQGPRVEFKVFFPARLSWLRDLEPYLSRLPLGAQYRLTARKA